MGMRLPQIPRVLFAALAYDLDRRASRVTDGEKRLSDSAGVVRAWQSEDDVMLELESGSYAFKWRND